MNFRPPPLIKTPRLLVFEKTSDPQTIKIPTCIKHLRVGFKSIASSKLHQKSSAPRGLHDKVLHQKVLESSRF